MQPVTIDIRDTLGDGFGQKPLQDLIDAEANEGREVTEIYCSEAQSKQIKKFSKTVASGKKGEPSKTVNPFEKVSLVVG